MSLQRLPMSAEIINKHFSDYSLLDIGCRTMALKPLLKGCSTYKGVDQTPGKDIIEANLENGLQNFEDNSFDVVVALDVLEHLENVHKTFKDMLRVAKKGVIVSLPNMYYWEFRWRFLTGKGISGKYAFPAQVPSDRHRWVLSYEESVEFIKQNCSGYNFETFKIIPERGRTKLVAGPIEKYLGEKSPNLFAYGSLFYIDTTKH